MRGTQDYKMETKKYIYNVTGCLIHPFVTRLAQITQNNSWHTKTALEHTLAVYHRAKEEGETDSFLVATLLHDIGKYTTRREDEKGETHFPNHEAVGYHLANGILSPTISNRNMILSIIQDHGIVHAHTLSGKMPIEFAYPEELRRFCLYEVETSRLQKTNPEEYLARKLLLEAKTGDYSGIKINGLF